METDYREFCDKIKRNNFDKATEHATTVGGGAAVV